jgi:hypothetical protein
MVYISIRGGYMNVSYTRSVATSIIFGILFAFLVIFFAFIGPEDFLTRKLFIGVNAIVIFTAMLSFAIMLLLTNKKSNVIDERDYLIQKKSSTIGLVISLIYVFLLSIILFNIYRDEGSMNVSWAWFIAYSTFSFGYFITALIHVYFYKCEN